MRGWITEARARGVVAYAKIADKASDEDQPGPVILARSRSFLLSRTSLALRIQSGGSIAAKQGIGAAERPNWRIIEGEADGRKKAVMTQAVLPEGREEAAMTRDGEDKRCRGISSERNPYISLPYNATMKDSYTHYAYSNMSFFDPFPASPTSAHSSTSSRHASSSSLQPPGFSISADNLPYQPNGSADVFAESYKEVEDHNRAFNTMNGGNASANSTGMAQMDVRPETWYGE